MTPTGMGIAMICLKLATAGGVSMGLVIFFKWFNEYEFKGKKNKGGVTNDATSHIENLRKKSRFEG